MRLLFCQFRLSGSIEWPDGTLVEGCTRLGRRPDSAAGMHSYNALEGGGCVFSGRTVGRVLARKLG
ncbi:hypothetical protein [Streptomyces sp. NPDC003077]|uniref:hypothetical protein n=1 Tax=Streptomyces sp. NPDC003077 TaxID=3154443 RepID=UPI0033B65E26